MEIKLNNINYFDMLKNVNYTFRENSVTSIIGKSGSGKSLLGLIIMNIVDDYDGSIIVNGKDSYDIYDFLKKVGYVFQRPWNHFICRTVEEEIGFGLKQNEYSDDKINEKVLSSLTMVGLPREYLKMNLIDLSSGEATKVAIAASLVMNPEVLILDEPTLYLDNVSWKNLLKLLKMLKNKYNKTIIVMSNDMDFVYKLGNNYVLMDKGAIIKIGKVKQMVEELDMFEEYNIEMPKLLDFINYLEKQKSIKHQGNSISSVKDLIKGVVDSD